MAYIYKITNDLNQKIYIGKTEKSIEKRFQEHCRDYSRNLSENRPLYAAMRKYGINHFHIELIEETDKPEERETYWIEVLGTFKYGYNATLGGDGKHYCDYDLIYDLYNQGKTIKEIAKILNYNEQTCSKALTNKKVTHEERVKRGILSHSKTIIQLDKDTNEILNIFTSITEAYKSMNKQHSGHIAEVCQGKRKTAYGYKWKYGN